MTNYAAIISRKMINEFIIPSIYKFIKSKWGNETKEESHKHILANIEKLMSNREREEKENGRKNIQMIQETSSLYQK